MPIYRGQPMIRCGFCGGTYSPQFKGQLCAICQVPFTHVSYICRRLTLTTGPSLFATRYAPCSSRPFTNSPSAQSALSVASDSADGPGLDAQIGEIGFKGSGLINSRHQRSKAAASAPSDDFDMDD